MTQEQKAIAYDEVREKIALRFGSNVAEEVFSEFEMSDDERIRKAIFIYLDWLDGRKDCAPRGEHSIRDMIAWLEKQGTSYTKRDVDDAYVEGMAFAKDELEKQKPTWSEEDEKMNDLIISVLEVNHSKGIFKVGLRAIRTEEIVSWLITLKQRYTWKPSKEQMDAMQMAVSYFGYSWISKEQELLESLYKDLKKL